jgi:hypothetical protein
MVVEVNEEDETVDIQYLDGAIEEIDLDEWAVLDLEPRDPPEDWTGPFEQLEPDDRGYE